MKQARRESRSGTRKALIATRQAFREFLRLPLSLIVAFLLLAGLSFSLERREPAWLAPAREFLQAYMFSEVEAVRNVLGVVAAGVITITSITISLLLIALQQSASALTHQVYDQFLRNWQNQFYFGFFVGLSLFALVTLASVGPLNPVVGASIALVGTVLALSMLLVLFYTTVHQMRPVVIISAIHDHALKARATQFRLVDRTRRLASLRAPVHVPVEARETGFVTRIDLDAIERACRDAGGDVEVVLKVSVGDFVVYRQALAEVNATAAERAEAVGSVLEDAVLRESKRDITLDPLDGIEELETIGWTSISTAQSDPDAGILTIQALRDILARWSEPRAADDATTVPVVYADNVMPQLLNAFESLAVVASESMQHQSYAEIVRTFDLLYERLPADTRHRTEDIILRTLSGLGDQILTAELERALLAWIATLRQFGRNDTADAIADAHERLARTVGKLGGRSTRAS
jgi:uncharacterized membrane protein